MAESEVVRRRSGFMAGGAEDGCSRATFVRRITGPTLYDSCNPCIRGYLAWFLSVFIPHIATNVLYKYRRRIRYTGSLPRDDPVARVRALRRRITVWLCEVVLCLVWQGCMCLQRTSMCNESCLGLVAEASAGAAVTNVEVETFARIEPCNGVVFHQEQSAATGCVQLVDRH